MLPEATDWVTYSALDLGSPCFVEAATVVAARCGISGDWARFSGGSYPVLGSATHVVKLTPPLALHQHVAERQALLALEAARSPISAPRLVAHGELEGWNYLAMTRVSGEAIWDAWASFERPLQRRVARYVGTLLALLHDVPFRDHFELAGDDGLVRQRREVRNRHQRRGIEGAALDEIEVLAERAVFSSPPVFLHSDLHGAHILLRDPNLPAVLDFGDAQAGPAAYDFVTPVCFYFGGDEVLLAAMFDAYSRRRAVPRLEELRAATVLHLFNDLDATLTRLGLPPRTSVTDALTRIWGTRD